MLRLRGKKMRLMCVCMCVCVCADQPSLKPWMSAWYRGLFCGMVWMMSPSGVTWPMAHWPILVQLRRKMKLEMFNDKKENILCIIFATVLMGSKTYWCLFLIWATNFLCKFSYRKKCEEWVLFTITSLNKKQVQTIAFISHPVCS